MNTEVKNTLLLLVGAIGIALISISATLTVERFNNLPATIPTPTIPAPAPSPAISINPVSTTAQVINVQPHYITKFVPYRRCYQVNHVFYYNEPQDNFPGAGAVIGGLAGGLAGQSIGEGRGRIAGGIAGAIVGALGGSMIQNHLDEPRAYNEYSLVCSTHYAKRFMQYGYEVTYLYNGEQKTTIMPNPPTSNTIPLPSVQN